MKEQFKGIIIVLLIMLFVMFIYSIYRTGYENGKRDEQEYTNHYKDLSERYKLQFEKLLVK